MPVRSLTSSVMRWPGRDEVAAAFREWAAHLAQDEPDLVAAGYFGSYARGDWGPGSDLDVVLILAQSPAPFIRRVAPGDATTLPVPADVLRYTVGEWRTLQRRHDRFARMLREETVWVVGAPPGE